MTENKLADMSTEFAVKILNLTDSITKPRTSKPLSCKQSKIFFLHSQMLISQAFGFFYCRKDDNR